MNSATIRIYDTCPETGNVFVRVASHAGVALGLLPSLQQLPRNPNSVPQPQANLWPCDSDDRMHPGGGRA